MAYKKEESMGLAVCECGDVWWIVLEHGVSGIYEHLVYQHDAPLPGLDEPIPDLFPWESEEGK